MWTFIDFVSEITARLVASHYNTIGTAIEATANLKNVSQTALGLDGESYHRRLEDAESDLKSLNNEMQKIDSELKDPGITGDKKNELKGKKSKLQAKIDKAKNNVRFEGCTVP